MAGDKLIVTTKLKASTMVEVLIAMVLIFAVFGIAMMIYTNVLNSSQSVKKLRAQAILNNVLLKAEQASTNVTQTFSVGDFRIEQKVTLYGDNDQLSDICLTAYDDNQQKITEIEKVIINSNE